MKTRILFLTISFLATGNYAISQSIPQDESLGKVAPDYSFTKVKHYHPGVKDYDTLNLKEFRGKWLVLDFWTRSCTPCVNSFPKLDELQKKFKDKAQIILVGINDMYNYQTESYFEGVRIGQKIQLPIAYDTVLVKTLKLYFAGTLVFINPEGIIKKVTMTADITEKNFSDIVKRQE